MAAILVAEIWHALFLQVMWITDMHHCLKDRPIKTPHRQISGLQKCSMRPRVGQVYPPFFLSFNFVLY